METFSKFPISLPELLSVTILRCYDLGTKKQGVFHILVFCSPYATWWDGPDGWRPGFSGHWISFSNGEIHIAQPGFALCYKSLVEGWWKTKCTPIIYLIGPVSMKLYKQVSKAEFWVPMGNEWVPSTSYSDIPDRSLGKKTWLFWGRFSDSRCLVGDFEGTVPFWEVWVSSAIHQTLPEWGVHFLFKVIQPQMNVQEQSWHKLFASPWDFVDLTNYTQSYWHNIGLSFPIRNCWSYFLQVFSIDSWSAWFF